MVRYDTMYRNMISSTRYTPDGVVQLVYNGIDSAIVYRRCPDNPLISVEIDLVNNTPDSLIAWQSGDISIPTFYSIGRRLNLNINTAINTWYIPFMKNPRTGDLCGIPLAKWIKFERIPGQTLNSRLSISGDNNLLGLVQDENGINFSVSEVQWYLNDTLWRSAPNSLSAPLTQSGFYSFRYRRSPDECFSERTSNMFADPLSARPTLAAREIQVYPNPGREGFTIHSDGEMITDVVIYSTSGNKIKTITEAELIQSSGKITTTEMATGLYQLHISTPSRKYVTKWVKQ